MILTEYDIHHVTQKVAKGSVLSDYLAHKPLKDYQSMHFEFLDEGITLIRDYNIPAPRKDQNLDLSGHLRLMELLTLKEMELG